tara:strand:- start:1143 stop:1799 length:657 start_codon:yes stop_codon:yes gene_type:complete
MNKLKVTHLPVEDIIPNPNNPRIIQDAIIPVANSIKEFGFLVPVVVNENNIILAGHARHAAAKFLEMKKIPVVQAKHLEPAQAQAFMLADNRLTEKADYDHKILAEVIASLDEQNFDLAITGFDKDEIDNFLDASAQNFDHLLNDDEQNINIDTEIENLDTTQQQENELQRLSFFFDQEQKNNINKAIEIEKEQAEGKISNGNALANAIKKYLEHEIL